MRLIFVLMVLVSYSCADKKEICLKGKDDMKYEFIESIKPEESGSFLYRIEDIRQFGSISELIWLRKPENILIFYGTLKSIGLNKFISKQEYQKSLFTDHWAETVWANKSLEQIVDSLIKEYKFIDSKENYFTKFWKRRILENNKNEVYKILLDIREYYNGKSIDQFHEINDTLKSLLLFEVKKINQDYSDEDKFYKEYTNTLIKYKLFASAYNLVRAREDYNQTNDTWYEETITKIASDSTDCKEYWKWRESAIWNSDIFDYHHK